MTLGNGSTLTVNGTFTNGLPSELAEIGESGGCVSPGASFLCLSGPGNVASLYSVQNNSLIAVDAGTSLGVTGGGFANNSGVLSLEIYGWQLKLDWRLYQQRRDRDHEPGLNIDYFALFAERGVDRHFRHAPRQLLSAERGNDGHGPAE